MIKPTKTIPIEKLKPQSKNVKIHSKEQIDALAKIISNPKIGFNQPIVIDKKNNIWAGHARLEAAKKLGMKEVPVVYLGDLTEDEKKAYMIMENRINESPWNKENLEIILDEIKFDFKPYEMSFDDLIQPKIQEETQPIPEPPEIPTSKLGNIYQLGAHKVMCGDATKDLNKLYHTKPDLLLTDPPYGINLDTDWSKMTGPNTKIVRNVNTFKKIENDDKPFNPSHLLDFNEVFLWGADYYAKNLPVGSWFVWDKRQTEELDRMYGSVFEVCWSKQKHRKEIIRLTWAGFLGHNKKEDTDRKIHPTQKPVKLMRWFIQKFSKANHSILDPYLGSGSTLIACEQTNRICYGMEIDPHYVDVIVKRWENFTGKKAKLLP